MVLGFYCGSDALVRAFLSCISFFSKRSNKRPIFPVLYYLWERTFFHQRSTNFYSVNLVKADNTELIENMSLSRGQLIKRRLLSLAIFAGALGVGVAIMYGSALAENALINAAIR